MKDKKVLFLISSELFYRNYVKTGVLEFLAQNYSELFVLASKEVSPINHKNVVRYQIDERNENRHYQFLRILGWRYRHRSRSFSFRLFRNSQFKFDFKQSEKVNTFSETVKANFASLKRRIKILSAGSLLLFPVVQYLYKKKLKPPKNLIEIIKQVQPDVVVMPSSAYDPVVMDLINISKIQNIKSILLVDNWDNLSSKSILWELPDAVAVWGKQTKQFALDIQKFKDEQVTCIGSARFDNYFRVRHKELNSHFEFKYILFLGQSLPSKEIAALKILNAVLGSQEFFDLGLKIVYRPHPWAMNQGIPDLTKLNAVVLDPQIAPKDPLRRDIVSFQPSLEYYPSLLKNAEFVVSGLTSMLIEASIFHKNIIAIAHEEPGNYTSPHKLLTECMHFEGIDCLPNLTISRSKEELTEYFKKFLAMKHHSSNIQVDSELSHFIMFEGKYNERLRDFINQYL
tara:strand:- start:364 stop:1731 length:1368 start_codon:yes stop_codon:yes gene_type:complete